MKDNRTPEAEISLPDFVKTETLALERETAEKHGPRGILAGRKMLEVLQVADASICAIGTNNDEICLIMEILAKQLDIHARGLRAIQEMRRLGQDEATPNEERVAEANPGHLEMPPEHILDATNKELEKRLAARTVEKYGPQRAAAIWPWVMQYHEAFLDMAMEMLPPQELRDDIIDWFAESLIEINASSRKAFERAAAEKAQATPTDDQHKG